MSWWRDTGVRFISRQTPHAGKRHYRHVAIRNASGGTMLRSVVSAMLLCQGLTYAQLGPQPPCGEAALQPYPGPDDSPHREVLERVRVRPRLAAARVHRLGRRG